MDPDLTLVGYMIFGLLGVPKLTYVPVVTLVFLVMKLYFPYILPDETYLPFTPAEMGSFIFES